MIIVIPTEGKRGLEEELTDHFGRCKTYTFLDENGKLLKIIENTSEHTGGKGLPPELMKERGANILLCHDLGPRALNLCREFGIEIYCSQAQTVRKIFALWKDNKLQKASVEDVCAEHKHQ